MLFNATFVQCYRIFMVIQDWQPSSPPVPLSSSSVVPYTNWKGLRIFVLQIWGTAWGRPIRFNCRSGILAAGWMRRCVVDQWKTRKLISTCTVFRSFWRQRRRGEEKFWKLGMTDLLVDDSIPSRCEVLRWFAILWRIFQSLGRWIFSSWGLSLQCRPDDSSPRKEEKMTQF